MRKRLAHIDYFILIPYLVLLGIGIVMVYSASSDIMAAAGKSPTAYLNRQTIFVIGGLFAAALGFILPLRLFASGRFVRLAVGVTMAMLFGLLVMGYFRPDLKVNGAMAWFDVGFFNVQPVEIAKLVLVLYLARILSRREEKLTRFHEAVRQIIAPMIVAGLMAMFVLLEPDTGGMAILLFLTLLMIAASGIKWSYGALIMGGVVGFSIGGLQIMRSIDLPWLKKSYQIKRLLAFFHPFKLENSVGRQLVNSYYAISNGGWFGVGIGNSIQKKGYLPEPYTDFIMSVITEELGIIGAIVVLGILFFLIGRIVLVGIRAQSAYRSLVCYGIGAWLFVQTLFNVGGMSGLLPITGVTLPFISYGGSSMLMLSAAIGLAMNVSCVEQVERERQQERGRTSAQAK
ncbi:FtsW/RodA/SpoVE family cell cycle protein [Schleiferilactobacillus harbinensis]|uniref:Probable peptidoglycan glycosyltransferase FtsW n=1 Tax=Schleiferilactobacillus harbinensis TaxID=304207 RepID=A0ABU7SWS2_9LACO